MRTKFLPTLKVFLPIGLLVLINSCTIYEPQLVSIPLISEKNEIQLNGGVSILSGMYGSVAYAPAQHVALQVYGSIYPENLNFQGSVGYVTKSLSNVNFEFYGGFGIGNGTKYSYENKNTVYKNTDYSLYFVQANFGQTNLSMANIDYGFGLKAGMFDALVRNDLNSPISPYNSTAILIEPQAFVRMGGEKIKIGFQMNGTKFFMSSTNKLSSEFYLPFNFGISLNYTIAPSLRNK